MCTETRRLDLVICRCGVHHQCGSCRGSVREWGHDRRWAGVLKGSSVLSRALMLSWEQWVGGVATEWFKRLKSCCWVCMLEVVIIAFVESLS